MNVLHLSFSSERYHLNDKIDFFPYSSNESNANLCLKNDLYLFE